MTPVLNWKEIEVLTRLLQEQFQGLFLDRIIVPKREDTKEGYLKSEALLQFKGFHGGGNLLLSTRNQKPFLCPAPEKAFRANPAAPKSPFFLQSAKLLKGMKVLQVFQPEKERMVVFEFGKKEEPLFHLIFSLIPAQPELLLLNLKEKKDDAYQIELRSRKKEEKYFSYPKENDAPEDLKVHLEWFEGFALFEMIQEELKNELQKGVFSGERKKLQTELKKFQKRNKQTLQALEKTRNEPDWMHYGELLKQEIGKKDHQTKNLSGETEIGVMDYATNQEVWIPFDLKKPIPVQIEELFKKGKRKKAKLEDLETRNEEYEIEISKLEKEISELKEEFEENPEEFQETPQEKEISKKKGKVWSGRSFISKEGLPIWVGKSVDENLKLTFQFGRGNDLWFHVRGKPGAHAIVPLRDQKEASLETLLDAATLTLYFSDGKNWGKTEVDYTYKKYVKRIPKSKKVTYSQNKTLMIAVEEERLKRLLKK